MAKGSISKKAAKKAPVRMGRSAVASMNRRNYGDEPEYGFIPLTLKEAGHAFNWYSLNCDRKQSKQFVVEWLEDNNRPEDASVIRKLSDSRAKAAMATGCWIARMWTRGAIFDQQLLYAGWFEEGLKRARAVLNREEDDLIEEDEDGNVTKVTAATKSKKFSHPSIRMPYYRTPAEKKFDRFLELMNEALDAIDIHDSTKKSNYRYTFIDAIRKEQLDLKYAQELLAELKAHEVDIRACLGGDPELTASHRHRASSLRRKQALVATLLMEVTTYLSEATKKQPKAAAGAPSAVEVVRKPRKKKPVSIDKLVSRLLYQEKDDELGLVSIPKEKVIGAKELWLYNTKYANLTVYRTEAEAGFSVRGTTLLNYDETASISKKIGRRAKEHTGNLLLSTKPQLRKFMDTISATPTKPNGRINENTILLRAL